MPVRIGPIARVSAPEHFFGSLHGRAPRSDCCVKGGVHLRFGCEILGKGYRPCAKHRTLAPLIAGQIGPTEQPQKCAMQLVKGNALGSRMLHPAKGDQGHSL